MGEVPSGLAWRVGPPDLVVAINDTFYFINQFYENNNAKYWRGDTAQRLGHGDSGAGGLACGGIGVSSAAVIFSSAGPVHENRPRRTHQQNQLRLHERGRNPADRR